MSNKTVLITGASRGIGRECAIRFAKEGYTVGIGCRDLSAGRDTAESVSHSGGKPILFVCDLRDSGQIKKAVCDFKDAVGSPEILVNCAGVACQKLFQDTNEDDYNLIMDSNLRSAYLLTKEILPDMISAKSGKIIFISSMWGQVGGSCEVVYSASKAALIGMTKALAKEVGPSGIRVNCVSPGVILTDMTSVLGQNVLDSLADETPLCRNGNTSDIAESVFWLCSDAASFITGQVLGVNGGSVI